MSPEQSPEQLEREIALTRTEMDQTLSAIQDRLSPDVLMHQAVDYVRKGAGGYVSNLGTTIKQNPVPFTLLGISLAWLMVSGRGGPREGHPEFDEHRSIPSGPGKMERMGSAVSEAGTRISDTAHGVADKARGASDWARAKGTSARISAGHLASGAREGYYRARNGFETTVNDYPLILGAFGVALGAAIGASLPATRREDEWMGDASDRLVDEVKTTAREEFDKNRERLESVAERAAEAAKDEAHRQGLTSGASPVP